MIIKRLAELRRYGALYRAATKNTNAPAETKFCKNAVLAGEFENTNDSPTGMTNVPTTFIIDTDGKIAQIDLFGATLKQYVRKLINK